MTNLKPLTNADGELNLTIGEIKKRYGIVKDAHINFAFAYLSDPRRSGKRAYAKVYHGGRPKAADGSRSSELLRLTSPTGKLINDMDTSAAQVMMRRNLITKEQVIKELIKVGFSDIGDLYDEDNNLLNITDMDLDVTPAVRKIKEKVMRKSMDDETGEETTVLAREIEMHDKKGSLQLIGQHLQMFVQKGELQVTTSVDDIIRDITEKNAANRNGLLPKDNIRKEDRLTFDND